MRKAGSSAVDVSADVIGPPGTRTDENALIKARPPNRFGEADDDAPFDDADVMLGLAQYAQTDPGPERRAPLPPEMMVKGRQLVAGRYRLLSLIGEGGFGAVYEAEHVELRKRVALKLLSVLRGLTSQRAELTHRLVRDARRVSRLAEESDAHVAHIFDAGDDEHLGPFVVMELLHGDNLDHALAVRGGLETRTACVVIYQACLGLESAHAQGIVHRGLKPANVYLTWTPEGTRVKLLDFGVAHLVRDASVGPMLVSPQYMAPEQAVAEESADARVDIYALGAIFYEMLVGTPLVPSYPNYERTILHITTLEPLHVSEALPDIEPGIDELVAAMVAPLDKRIRTPREVCNRLLRMFPDLGGDAASLPPAPTVSGMQSIRPRRARAMSEPPVAPAIAQDAPPASRATREDQWLRLVVACMGALVMLLAVAAAVRLLGP